MIDSGQDSEADIMVNCDKNHGRNWLVGKAGKTSASTSTPAPTDHYVQELTMKIKRDLESELEDKVNRKVQENMTWVLKKLGDANPGLKLDVRDFCATMSSDQEEMDTPVTQRGAAS